jgi:class 3 adenylate cyclase/tetratricopeptide (TPR) repeat protein
MAFCGKCGVSLAGTCPQCGFENPVDFEFCGKCGTSFTDQPAATPEHVPSDAERRQLTVMFCDLVGSTALSTRLDPEDYREVIRAYQDTCTAVITRYDGYVAKFMGDGVLAYFGWPRGHEDDAGRAISSGLGIIEAVGDIDLADDETEPFAVRIGIATGPVVVGDIVGEGAAQEAAVTGETPNLAARLQAIAEPNIVVIAATTHALAGGLFAFQALGGQSLKGIAGSTEVWQVVAERQVESRFAAAHSAALTPLIGREEELELLSRRWKRAKGRKGQVVLLSGEPGIGKSRLTRALQDWIGDEPHTRLLLQCSPHHSSSALYPTINQLEIAARFESSDDTNTRLDKLEGLLQQSGQPIGEATPLIAALLSIPADDRYQLPELTPQQQKSRTLGALIDQLVGLAAQQPVLFVFEDAHWIDPTSLELLEQVIERIIDLPVLMVVTYRPEFTAPWIGLPHVTLQALNRLTARDCTRMMERLIGERNLPSEIYAQIAERTDGVPLFVEELTRSVVETGSSATDVGDNATANIVIPATLQDALEARFDRSPAVREVAQVGAAIGREFPYDLLSGVVSLTSSELDAALGDLIGSGLIFARGAPPDASYTFKHALVQDTAYDSMVRSKRQDTHQRIAENLLSLQPEITGTGPETLAHHYTEAGLLKSAVEYWVQAGKLATSRSANSEAVALLECGLAVVAKLPPGEERDRSELDVQIALLGPLIPTRGQTSPDFVNAVNQALELCEQIDAPDEWFRATCAKIVFHIMSEQMVAGHELAATLRQKAKLAVQTGTVDDGVLVIGQDVFARTLFFLGRLTEALEEYNQVPIMFDRKRHDHLRFGYLAMDPEVTSSVFRAIPLWLLGWPDQARKMADHAVSKALELGHVNTLGMTLVWAGTIMHMMLRDLPEIGWIGTHYDDLTSQHNLPVYKHNLTMFHSLLEISEHPSSSAATSFQSDGIDQMLKATRGPTMVIPTFYCWLAEAFLAANEPDQALDAINKSLELIDESEERWYEPEAHRIRGIALTMADGSAQDKEAEASMLKAIEVAKSQSAKSLELRAATSLARLWQSQGKTTEAHELLAPVYGWFTEGFDTLDLIDAKALLDELS